MNSVKISLLIYITILLTACGQKHVFSDYQPVPKQKWSSSDTLTFTFDIPEDKNCRISLSARHRKDYEFSNLWLKVRLTTKQLDTSFRQEMPLFNAEGRPYGECSGSACTQTIPVKGLQRLTKGSYRLQIIQLMRKDPLEGIQDVGVIVDAP